MSDQRQGGIAWRTLEQYPGYRFGSDGSVWSCWKHCGTPRAKRMSDQWRRLRPSPKRCQVQLGRGRSRYVARLILEAFVGPCPPGMEACHFPDPDIHNNAVGNLRWDTSAANTNDQRKHGTLVGGERHGQAKLTNAQVDEIRAMAGVFTQHQIAGRFGISQGHVSEIVNRAMRTASSHAGRGL